MRLDKFLCECTGMNRKDAKSEIKKNHVLVNGVCITDSGYTILPNQDSVSCNGKELQYREFIFYVLNKPAGYVCSENESEGKTVISLLPAEYQKRLNPVGRLDKETTGLLIFTNDGNTSHRLLSPKNHVDKTYLVTCEKAVTDDDIKRLESGVSLGDDEFSLPAAVEKTDKSNRILMTIHEGRFHQVKRMMQATCNKVTGLKRISFGSLSLDDLALKEGEGRTLSDEEVNRYFKSS